MGEAEHRSTWITKTVATRREIAPAVIATSAPSRPRALRRLRLVSLLLIAISASLWFTTNLIQEHLRDVFRTVGQWGPPVVTVVASLLMYAVATNRSLPPALILRVGLGYEVVISFAIVLGSSFGSFTDVRPEYLAIDRVGLSWVIPWTLFFTVLVQAPVREAVLALFVSASAPSIGYAIEQWSGRAPALPPDLFAALFVLPYLMGVAMTTIAARIVHELGQDVLRARELGSYHLESRLGQGGMGEVWRATHHTLARPAAIKIIRPDALDREPEQARLAAVRFEREAQAIASLQSRHTVQLYDFGVTQEGTLYHVMELLDGMDLEELVRREGPMPPARVVHLLLQACASLAEAHQRGVIHRDIKPANIYLCRDALECDVVKILDFGLAKRVLPVATPGELLDTRTDVITGTPAYLAPEAIGGEGALDGRTDLYALGCVAHWMLTGRLVFEADSAMQMLAAHLERTPAAPSVGSPFPVPAALDRLILECLAKRPEDRPASAEVMAARLREVVLDAPWTAVDASTWWESRLAAGGDGRAGSPSSR